MRSSSLRKVITTMDKALDLLPELNEYEGFCCFLLMRRKWIIKRNPDKEEEIRELFKGDQILISKDVLHGTKRHMKNRLKKSFLPFFLPGSARRFTSRETFLMHTLFTKIIPMLFLLW